MNLFDSFVHDFLVHGDVEWISTLVAQVQTYWNAFPALNESTGNVSKYRYTTQVFHALYDAVVTH